MDQLPLSILPNVLTILLACNSNNNNSNNKDREEDREKERRGEQGSWQKRVKDSVRIRGRKKREMLECFFTDRHYKLVQ